VYVCVPLYFVDDLRVFCLVQFELKHIEMMTVTSDKMREHLPARERILFVFFKIFSCSKQKKRRSFVFQNKKKS